MEFPIPQQISLDGSGNGYDNTAEPPTQEIVDSQNFAQLMTNATDLTVKCGQDSNVKLLDDLIRHQGILLESLQHENEKFSTSDYFRRLENNMNQCKVYLSKLVTIKKTMNGISARSAKLKRQCARLQELKSKSAVEAEEEKRKELDREKLLEAQPAEVVKDESDPSSS